MSDESEKPDRAVVPGQHGGYRPGAGRPSGSTAKATELLGAAKAKKVLEEAKIRELERRRLEGSMMAVADAMAQALAFGNAVKQAFTALPARIASLLVGRNDREIEIILEDEITKTLEDVRGQYEQIRPRNMHGFEYETLGDQ